MSRQIRNGVIAVLLLFAARSAAAAVSQGEHDALVAIYNATGGSKWANAENWLGAAGSECTWHGVVCDDSGLIVTLDLHRNQLSGTIPPQIGALKSLRELFLYENQISGSIPSEIGQLTQLTALYLADNALTGAVPSSIGSLKNLLVLHVRDNQLSSLPSEIWSLTSLNELLLSGNKFTGAIPSGVANLSNLRLLDLSRNQFTGAIPEALGGLANLQELTLSVNELSGPIPSALGNLAALTELRLGENDLSGSIPPELGKLTNLTLLDLGHNQISGSIPAQIGDLKNIQRLWLGNNRLSGSIPEQIPKLTQLIDFTAEKNQLTGAIPPTLASLPALETLWLEDNQLTGPLPAELTEMKTLRALSVENNRLSGQLPAHLLRMPAIRTLYAANNAFTGTIPTDIDAPNLRDLTLHNNQLTGTIPDHIDNLPNLRTLYLAENALTGSIPSQLSKLTNLGDLDLNANQLTGTIPSSLGQLKGLTRLSLSWNQLSGPLPPELFSLTELTKLDLSALSLTGSIPSTVGDLTKLEYLLLGGNQLTGTIPSSVGNLTHLLHLDLWANSLSGAIPSELWRLTQLERLELNDNALTGTVPSSIGDMGALDTLSLGGNRFSGTLPAELGKLTRLRWLDVSNNQFSGAVPSQIANLTNLPDGCGLSRFNALFTTDSALNAFLQAKDERWSDTQTVLPTNVTVSQVTDRSAVVSWTPIAYSYDEGGYQVTATPRGSGSRVISTTRAKDHTSLLVRPLEPSTTYDFVVRTVTHPHETQQSLLVSDATAAVSGTTLAKIVAPADVGITMLPTGLVQIGGVPQNTDSFAVTNFGDTSTTVTLTTDGAFFQVSPAAFALAGGATQTITITSVANQSPGAYRGSIWASGSGVHEDFDVDVRLLCIQQVPGHAVAEAALSRVEVVGDIGAKSIASATFVNRGTATLYGILLSDAAWISVPAALVQIDPASTYTVNFTVDRAKRPDAGSSGTISGSLRLVYADVAGASAAAFQPLATTTPGLSVTIVTVVDTAKPALTSGSIPVPAAGEVVRFIAGISTMARTAEQFATDVSVSNTFGVAPITDLRMYLTTVGSSTPAIATFGSVHPSTVLSVTNVASNVYGAKSHVGTLQIRSADWSRMIVNGRLLNQAKKSSVGTMMPVFRSDRSARAGQSIYLPGIRKSASEHTNIAIQETAGNSASIQVAFLDATGAPVGTARPPDSLAPYGLLELADGAPSGAVTAIITNLTGSAGNAAAYATVIDETSGETWTVVDWSRYYDFSRSEAARLPFARSVASGGGGRRRAVRASGASAATDLTIFNPDATPASLQLRYVDSNGSWSAQTITLAAHETRTIADAVRTLTGSSATSYGAILIDPVRGTFAASSRTVTSAANVKSGSAAPLISSLAGLRIGQKQTFAGVDDSASGLTSPPTAGRQTALGLVETSGSAVTVRATMLLSDGKSPFSVVVSHDFKLQPSQIVVHDSILAAVAAQFTGISFSDVHDLQVELKVVEGSGAVTPFLVVSDPNTGASMIRLE